MAVTRADKTTELESLEGAFKGHDVAILIDYKGINVPQVFAFTFAFGCGLAGLGGALSAEILGLDPYFPLKFMIYFLIMVTVGGSSSPFSARRETSRVPSGRRPRVDSESVSGPGRVTSIAFSSSGTAM